MTSHTLQTFLVRASQADGRLPFADFRKHAKSVGAKHLRNVALASDEGHHLLKKGDSHSESQSDDDDATGGTELLWTAEVQIGKGHVVVAFDSASLDTVINKSAYHHAEDAVNTHKTWKTQYSSGQEAAGTVYLDQLDIAGILLKAVPIHAANSDFLKPEDFGKIKGLAGLGYPQPNPKREFSGFLPALFASNELPANVFSFSFEDDRGLLTLGGVEENVPGEPVWSKVIANTHGAWYIPARINGIEIKAIIDTGSAAIVAPVAQAKELFAKLPQVEAREKDGVAYAVLKDKNAHELPEIDFEVDGQKFRLSKRATIYQEDDDGRPALSITGQNSFTDNTWIVGALLLQDFVTVFDWDHKRVGFVPTHENH